MDAREFKKARLALGITARKLGFILNVQARTVRAWERDDGKNHPPKTSCRVMEWMLDGYRPPQWKDRYRPHTR